MGLATCVLPVGQAALVYALAQRIGLLYTRRKKSTQSLPLTFRLLILITPLVPVHRLPATCMLFLYETATMAVLADCRLITRTWNSTLHEGAFSEETERFSKKL